MRQGTDLRASACLASGVDTLGEGASADALCLTGWATSGNISGLVAKLKDAWFRVNNVYMTLNNTHGYFSRYFRFILNCN